jgi:hypothetical protein
VYNWDQRASVQVDLANVLSVGQSYVIRNVQDFYGDAGTPAVTGVFSGGTVSVPLGGITPPVPLYGRPYTRPPVTGPSFNVFVVMGAGS